MLRDIPYSLAAPFIRQELESRSVPAAIRDIDNVLFKLRAAGLCADVVENAGPSLKALQHSCLDMPTVFIREDRESCAMCPEPARLVEGKRLEIFNQKMPQGMRYAPAEGPTRFRAFTYHAGLQHAVFQPKQCLRCQCHYLAGWMYKVERNSIRQCKWIGPCPAKYFVVPKQKSWLAVDIELLSASNSQILHQVASFESIFRVWAAMHPEPWQQSLLKGDMGTLETNNTQRLEDAWMAWSAITWADRGGQDIVWDFSTLGAFDETLCSYRGGPR